LLKSAKKKRSAMGGLNLSFDEGERRRGTFSQQNNSMVNNNRKSIFLNEVGLS